MTREEKIAKLSTIHIIVANSVVTYDMDLKYNNINSSCMGSGDIRLSGYHRKKSRFDH